MPRRNGTTQRHATAVTPTRERYGMARGPLGDVGRGCGDEDKLFWNGNVSVFQTSLQFSDPAILAP